MIGAPNGHTSHRDPFWVLPVVLALAAGVLVFRAAAWLSPSDVTGATGAASMPLNGLGVLFVACGTSAWLLRPSGLTRVFLVYGLCGGIHWGGAIGMSHPAAETSLLVLYAAATAVADGAFLDLALRYPGEERRRDPLTLACYGPGGLAALAVPVAPLLPAAWVGPALSALFALAFLMSLMAGTVFLIKWIRADALRRRRLFLTPVVAAMIVPTVTDLAAGTGVLPGEAAAWKLGYGAVPVVLAWALVRVVRAGEIRPAITGGDALG